MQQLTKVALVLVAASCLMAGCANGTGYDSNPAGADAGKTDFSKDDARSAQPTRGGSESGG